MFFRKPYIAIDIGSSTVKMLEILPGNDCRLKSIGYERLPSSAVVDGELREPEVVKKVIISQMKKLGIKGSNRRVAVALSGSSVLIKNIIVEPFTNQADESEQMYADAEQAFQHDMSELYFRYRILDFVPEEGKKLGVLVGAKRSIVDSYCELIKDIGLKVGLIDCDVFSIANMFSYNYSGVKEFTAVVNIGATKTQVILLREGVALFNRDIPFGGNNYNERIATELSISIESAESLKLTAATSDDKSVLQVRQIIKEVNEILVDDIARTIDYYYQTEDPALMQGDLKYLFLLGGSVKLPDLDTSLAARMTKTKTAIMILNPFKEIDINYSGAEMGAIVDQSTLYGTAVGLALRKFGDDAKL